MLNIIETNLEFNSNMVERKTTKRGIFHNSGTTVRQAIDVIHSYHKNTNKWAGIGYHLYIRRDGSIYRGRPENMQGAHARGANSDSIGICFEGNLNEEYLTKEQIEAGRELVAYLREKYGDIEFTEHRKVCNTDCPGANFNIDEIVNGTKTDEIHTTVDNTYSHQNFVKDVQSAIGAKVDGIAGPETLSKTVTVSRRKNNRHAVVKPIQRYLNVLGFNCGAVDGIAGKLFDGAVKNFQKANGCVVDGEITARNKTWKKLLKLM